MPSARPCPGCGAPLGFHRQLCDTCRDGRRADRRSQLPSSRNQLKYSYGLTPERFARLVAEQGGLCAACGKALPLDRNVPAYQRPTVDHDHRCCPGLKVKCGGRCIRGVIHARCNRGLGQLGDDPEVYRRAAEYVERANERLGALPRELPLDVAPRRRSRHPGLFEVPGA